MHTFVPAFVSRARAWLFTAALGWALALTGCASLPAHVERAASYSRVAPADSPVVRAANEAAIPPGRSGVWPMPVSSFALDARLALIRQTRASLDLQYYHIANDEVGRAILRESYNAALRGVRVRLLVDDLHTVGLDPHLAALAATPNIEVRLFNPFAWGRDGQFARYAAMLADFGRLNNRMHNKLFIADGTVAVVGGRNLADEYFFRSATGNFLDMDFVVLGEVAPRLGALFDAYWNSDAVYPARAVIRTAREPTQLRADFEQATAHVQEMAGPDPATRDILGQPSMTAVLAGRERMPVYVADVYAHADSTNKIHVDPAANVRETVTGKFVQALRAAQREVLVINPYFIPGANGMAEMDALRKRGVALSVVTNSFGTSDEPLVNIAYLRYRNELVSRGVRIFELSNEGVRRDPALRKAIGDTQGLLHAKLAFIDRQTVLAGSMNLDARSAATNTEIGLLVKSPALADRLLSLWKFEESPSVHEVRRKRDGDGLEWVMRDADGEHVRETDPDGNWAGKLMILIQSVFVPEALL